MGWGKLMVMVERMRQIEEEGKKTVSFTILSLVSIFKTVAFLEMLVVNIHNINISRRTWVKITNNI